MSIGAFTVGGGYAMLTMVEKSVVQKKGWLTENDFWDMIVIVQSIPGVFAVNTALYTGCRIKGVKGALCAVLGAILPSFVIICLVAIFFVEIQHNEIVERVFKGIRPCVVALILVPAINMFKTTNINWKTIIVVVLAALLVWKCEVSPIFILILGAVGGLLVGIYSYYKLNKK
jgi:chromate transporter